ncbi:hypothetical protein ACVSNS_01515 [Pseudomonas aeruginosa]
MLLKRSRIFIPIGTFTAISIGFWVIQLRYFDVIGWNYNVCHALFGFAFPMAFSYLGIFPRASMQCPQPLELTRRVLAVPLFSWPLAFLRLAARSIARDFNEGVPWTSWVGVSITLSFSIANEMFYDPVANGIPFIHAYENFVSDLLGLVAFILLTRLVIGRKRHGATRPERL